MEFGQQLKRWRKRKRKLSQEGLAGEWGVSTATISRWELGKHSPEDDHITLIEKATSLRVPPPDPPELVIGYGDRLLVLEAKVIALEQRLAALEPTSPGEGDEQLAARQRQLAQEADEVDPTGEVPPQAEDPPDAA